MGRPEKPIVTRDGAVADFAEELRRLRKQADLTVQKLAQRAHCSTGAISSAASGRALPSWQIARAYIAGCGQDPEDWQERWEAAAARAGVSRAAPGGSGERAGTGPEQQGRGGSALPDTPSLESIAVPRDFHLALLALRVRRGEPSLRELCTLARNEGYVLPRSTLSDALKQTDKLPSMEVVEALLAACDVSATERDGWRWAWSRTAYLQQRGSKPAAERWRDRSPYPGLAAFDEDSAEIFYGRERMTAQLVGRLNETTTGMLAVIGPSGAGKSSLLRAGLLQTVVPAGLADAWPRLIMTPGFDPLQALAGELGRMVPISNEELLEQLRRAPDRARSIAATAVEQNRALPAQELDNRPDRLLVVVDQFEELFVLAQEDAREQFINALVSMASPGAAPGENAPAVVVLGVRSDFFHACARYPALIPFLEHPFLVGPMTEAELRIAITAPAAKAGLSIEDGLTEVILEDVRSRGGDEHRAGMLPLLAHALRQTWERREGALLTCRAYAGAGGLAGGLAASAETAYESLTAAQQTAARALLLQMIGVSEDGIHVRRRVPLKALDIVEHAGEVLRAFTATRLIIVDSTVAEIAHEALLRDWPRLAAWINEARARIFVEREVTEDAYAWERAGRDSAFLYTGSRLESVRSTSRDARELPRLVHDFLIASIRAEARRQRVGRGAVSALVVLVLSSTSAAFVALGQRNEALHQRDLSLQAQAASQQAQEAAEKAQAGQLEIEPIDVELNVASDALLAGSSAAAESVRSQIAKAPQLANRRAGLVLVFAGVGDGDISRAVRVADKVGQVLRGNDRRRGDAEPVTFAGASSRSFTSLNAPSNEIRLSIYLFKG